MQKLTTDQKAKRYEVFEKAIAPGGHIFMEKELVALPKELTHSHGEGCSCGCGHDHHHHT